MSFDEDYSPSNANRNPETMGSVNRSPTHERGQNSNHPILQGIYSVDEESCVYEGKWGMGSDYETSGITSDFCYTMKRPNQQGRMSDGPCSGNYKGFFMINGSVAKRVSETHFNLQFSPMSDSELVAVSGNGSNRLGEFSITGHYNPETSILMCMKIYASSSRTSQSQAKSQPNLFAPSSSLPPLSVLQNKSLYRFKHGSIAPHCIPGVDAPSELSIEMQRCYVLLNRMVSHRWSWPFLEPVDPVELNIPNYFEVIKEPMDLKTLRKLITEGGITERSVFASFMRRIYENAMKFNKMHDDIYKMAKVLLEVFDREYTSMFKDVVSFKRSCDQRKTCLPGDDSSDSKTVKKQVVAAIPVYKGLMERKESQIALSPCLKQVLDEICDSESVYLQNIQRMNHVLMTPNPHSGEPIDENQESNPKKEKRDTKKMTIGSVHHLEHIPSLLHPNTLWDNSQEVGKDSKKQIRPLTDEECMLISHVISRLPLSLMRSAWILIQGDLEQSIAPPLDAMIDVDLHDLSIKTQWDLLMFCVNCFNDNSEYEPSLLDY